MLFPKITIPVSPPPPPTKDNGNSEGMGEGRGGGVQKEAISEELGGGLSSLFSGGSE